MQIYVIDPYQDTEPHFPIKWIIPSYTSLLWNVQLFGLGYFEMTLPANDDFVYHLEEGRMLVRECDIVKDGTTVEYHNAMIIRKVTITYDAEQGYILKVSGKSVKDVLSQRIIWNPLEWDQTDLDVIMTTLIVMNAANPVGYATEKLNFALADQNSAQQRVNMAASALATAQENYRLAQIEYDQAVAQYGEDSPEAAYAKAQMDAAAEDVTLAEEELADARAELAEADKKVIYYQQFLAVSEDRAIPYFDTQAPPLTNPPEISVSLYGENLGEWCETIATEYGIGWDVLLTENSMIFKFIQGTDRHTTVEFSPEMDNLKNAEFIRDMSIYRNSGLAVGDGEGFDQYRVFIDGGTGERRYEEYIDTGITKDDDTSDTAYQRMVEQAGNSELVQYSNIESISGEIDTDGVYKIGTDFNMGDVVSVKMDFDISATTRLIEILYSDEADGTRTIGTFEEWEV